MDGRSCFITSGAFGHGLQYSTPYTQVLAVRTFRLCSRQEDHQLQENLAVYFTLLEKMARKENDVIQ